MNLIAAFIGRLLMALIFIVSGASKLYDYGPTEQLLAKANLPTNLAVPSGVFELVAGLCIALGIFTRLFSLLLAGFCLVTALFFHHQFTDPMQSTMALKNLAMAGGFLCLFAHTQVRWSYDGLRARRRADLAEADAAARAHAEELKLARAEARNEGRADVVATVPEGTVIAPRRRWFWQ